MADGIDIQLNVLGAKELERLFKILERKVGTKILKGALKKSAKRLQPEVVRRAPEETGDYKKVLAGMKAKPRRGRGVYVYGLAYPTREELGIRPNDPYYYPTAVEYGHKKRGGGRVQAYPHFRPAVDENASREFVLIGEDIRRAIDKSLGAKARA